MKSTDFVPFLSIVVPTRNRASCAEQLIRYLLNFNESFELIICDNSDLSELSARIPLLLADPRVKYSYTSERLSVVDNFNRGLAKAVGEYVVFLGDDDTISHQIFKYARQLKERAVDAVIFGGTSSVCHYFWPGVIASRWGDIGGSLFYSNFSGKEKLVDIAKEIHEAFTYLGTGPRGMPRAYLGIFSREVINNVLNRYTCLFGGVSPDVYSSHLISSVAKKVVQLDYPMIIPGASPASTSAKRAERSDVADDLGSNDHTGRFKNIDWNPQIPKYYSPFTVWALSLYQASIETRSVIPKSGFAYLYAQCLIFTRGNTGRIFTAIFSNRNGIDIILCLMATFLYMAKIIFTFVIEKIPVIIQGKPGGAKYELRGFNSIGEAVHVLEKQLKNIKIKTI